MPHSSQDTPQSAALISPRGCNHPSTQDICTMVRTPYLLVLSPTGNPRLRDKQCMVQCLQSGGAQRWSSRYSGWHPGPLLTRQQQPPCCWPCLEGTWPEVLHRQLQPCPGHIPGTRPAVCGLVCAPQRSHPTPGFSLPRLAGWEGLIPEGRSSSGTGPLGCPGIPGVRGHCLSGTCSEATLSIC